MNKICVYAICKNESQFVEQWYNSMKEADDIIVVDTGSTDDTVKKLEECGVRVFSKTWNPWRFDEPRNYALDLADPECNILVSTDLDEVFEPGWADILRAEWDPNKHTRASYKYAWSHNGNGESARIFNYNKIHNREWRWKYPVHELLARDNSCDYYEEETLNLFDKIYLHHYPDQTKSRKSYLDLLKLRAEENPDDDSYGKLYLSHEFYYQGLYEECVRYIKETMFQLSIFNTFTDLEKANIMLFLGDSNKELGKYAEAAAAYSNAIVTCPSYIDPYLNLAELYNSLGFYYSAIGLVKEAQNKAVRYYSWLERDNSWLEKTYDILSVSYYYIGDLALSLENVLIAYNKAPYDIRIQNNKQLVENYFYKPEN